MKDLVFALIPRKPLVHDVDIIRDGELLYTIHSRQPLDLATVQRIRTAFQDTTKRIPE